MAQDNGRERYSDSASRRRFIALSGLATAGVAGLSGCLDGDDDDGEDDTGGGTSHCQHCSGGSIMD